MEILIIEDEIRLAQHVSRALTEAGHGGIRTDYMDAQFKKYLYQAI